MAHQSVGVVNREKEHEDRTDHDQDDADVACDEHRENDADDYE
jgi:hypothetical protein